MALAISKPTADKNIRPVVIAANRMIALPAILTNHKHFVSIVINRIRLKTKDSD
jgi:hypothetical protein